MFKVGTDYSLPQSFFVAMEITYHISSMQVDNFRSFNINGIEGYRLRFFHQGDQTEVFKTAGLNWSSCRLERVLVTMNKTTNIIKGGYHAESRRYRPEGERAS